MTPKHIIALAPILTQHADLASFRSCLEFLEQDYQVTWVDPLEHLEGLEVEDFYQYWQMQIKTWANQVEGMIGFSLGGLLIHQALMSSQPPCKLISISTPSRMSPALAVKLNTILTLLKRDSLEAALMFKQRTIVANPTPIFWEEEDKVVENRLALGIQAILEKPTVKQQTSSNLDVPDLPILQLVGANSRLVTQENCDPMPSAPIKVIANAGMRVLEDNPQQTQPIIQAWMNNHEI